MRAFDNYTMQIRLVQRLFGRALRYEHLRSTTCLLILSVFVSGTQALTFSPPGRATDSNGTPFGPGLIITTAADSAYSVYAADVDGDGDQDVLSASRLDDKIAWYENDGGLPPVFTAHIITTAADGASSVYAADVDSDGHTDVLSASQNDGKIAWYENDGGSLPTFTSHTITTAADGARSVYAADLDSDGDLDVLSASWEDNKVAWYENNGASPPAFTTHVITTNADDAHAVYAADVDRDGDLDVLSASWMDKTIAWYENDGDSPPAFSRHVITTAADGAYAVHVADVDGDGDPDVLSASQNDDKIAWYENSGETPPAFTSHTITTNAAGALSVYAVDVDRDGDTDVLSASYLDNKVAWYENDGASPPAFTSHTITTSADFARSVYAADVDGDGDLDVLSASAEDDKIAWCENLGGQFALATTDTAPATIAAGQQDDLLRIVATHRGRAGDTSVELAALELLFEESAGHPLTSIQANNLVENLYVYRDNGSGNFEPGADTPVTMVSTLSLVAGRQTVVFADADPNVRVAFGTPVAYFVVVHLTSNAHNYTPHQFRVTHLTDPSDGSESASTAEDWLHDLPLLPEYAANVSSRIVTASVPAQTWVYLPLVLRDYMAYFEGPWEEEDNDSYAEANGPLRSDRDYYGYPDDAKDYFSIYLRTGGDITIDLTGHNGQGVQLQLFYQSVDNRVDYDLDPPSYHIEYTGLAGWYYIYIYTASGYNNTTSYTLRVVY